MKATTNKKSSKYITASKFIIQIGKLYAFEKKYKEDGLSYDEIKTRRSIDQKPLLEEYFTMLQNTKDNYLESSKMGIAVNYSLIRKDSLLRYLDDGRLELDNNPAEHLAKNYAVGRKNWLFCETPKGAEKSSMLYTIVQTAIVNNLKPDAYINWLLEHISSIKIKDIESLAPWSNSIPEELKK